MRKWLMLSFFAMTAFFLPVFAQQMGTTDQQVDCSSLSSAEQQFAKQLSPSAMKLFCTQFNADQRSSAMAMTGQVDSMGNKMTAEQAVRKVAQQNNMMMPMMQQQGGSCPVR